MYIISPRMLSTVGMMGGGWWVGSGIIFFSPRKLRVSAIFIILYFLLYCITTFHTPHLLRWYMICILRMITTYIIYRKIKYIYILLRYEIGYLRGILINPCPYTCRVYNVSNVLEYYTSIVGMYSTYTRLEVVYNHVISKVVYMYIYHEQQLLSMV